MEVTWDKGSSGLVFYTDAQYWREVENHEDAEDADDWDVDTSEYEVSTRDFLFKQGQFLKFEQSVQVWLELRKLVRLKTMKTLRMLMTWDVDTSEYEVSIRNFLLKQ